MNQIHSYIVQYSIGDYASILGILITVAGFWITLWQVYRSKSASIQAKESVEQFKQEVVKFKTVSDLSEIVAIIGEIKELNRQKQWKLLLYRYDDLKKRLIEIEKSNMELNKFQIEHLRNAILIIKKIANEIELAIEHNIENGNELSISRTNSILSNIFDKLVSVLFELKSVKGKSK